MKLLISSANKKSIHRFITSSVFPTAEKYLRANINQKRLDRIDEYLNSLNISDFSNRVAREIKSKDILIAGVNNLKILTVINGIYSIGVNPFIKMPGIKATIADLVSLITYGTTQTPAYPIFCDMFKYISDNIETLYNKFELDGEGY